MVTTRDGSPESSSPYPTPPVQSRRNVLDADGYRIDAHAVVIGINNYQDPQIPALRYAVADAQSMYDVLTDPQIGRFRPTNVKLMLDGQATYKRIKSEIGTMLPRRTDADSTVCIYFAGHGAPYIDAKTTSRDGMEKYLIPYDADADDLRASGLSMETIQDYFGYITSRQLIFFLDCCYSGGAQNGRSFDLPGIATRATLNDDFLESLASDARFVVTACGMNEVSLETTEIGHGLFSYFLVEGLKGAADIDRDGLVTMDELYAYLYENVERESQKLGGRMRPMRRGSASGDVYLTQYETAEQRRADAAHLEATAALEADDPVTARQLWQECVTLVPSHASARDGLAKIAERLESERARDQELLSGRQRVLEGLRRSRVLQVEDYAQALELLDSDPAALSPHLYELYTFATALADKRITTAQYLKSVQYARRNATPSQMAMPQPPMVRAMAEERKAERERTVQSVPSTVPPSPTAPSGGAVAAPSPQIREENTSKSSTQPVLRLAPTPSEERSSDSVTVITAIEAAPSWKRRGVALFVQAVVLGLAYEPYQFGKGLMMLWLAAAVAFALVVGWTAPRGSALRSGILAGVGVFAGTMRYAFTYWGNLLDLEEVFRLVPIVIAVAVLAFIGSLVRRWTTRRSGA